MEGICTLFAMEKIKVPYEMVKSQNSFCYRRLSFRGMEKIHYTYRTDYI